MHENKNTLFEHTTKQCSRYTTFKLVLTPKFDTNQVLKGFRFKSTIDPWDFGLIGGDKKRNGL